jgi:alkylhydroperoxidase family enzyme
MDIGSAVGRASGITEAQLMDIPRFEESDAFDEREKLVLRMTVALTKTPVEASDELFASLRRHFDDAQLVELSATIAWENFRARFNRGFAIAPQGFSEGAFCVVPERPPPAALER